MNDIAVIITPSAIVANGIYENKRRHVSISNTNQNLYTKAIEAYKNNNYEEIIRLGDIALNIETYSNGMFFVKNGRVYTKTFMEPAPEILSKRIIQFSKEGIPVLPLVHFWENLEKNTENNVKQQLYNFLEHNDIPITNDGCFIAYKSVTMGKDGNLWDIYTYNDSTGVGTHRNNVNDIVLMDREDVNDDPSVSCSSGLHAATFNYAVNTYGAWNSHVGENQKLIHVKINPTDVVSVPYDYNNEKIRVCKYKVIDTSEDRKPIVNILYEKHIDRSDLLEELSDFEDEPDNIDDEEDIYDAMEDEENTNSLKKEFFEIKARYDGRLEIPKSAMVESDLLNKHINIHTDMSNQNIIISISYDPNNPTFMREGFRISKSLLEKANMIHNEYVLEASNKTKQIIISLS